MNERVTGAAVASLGTCTGTGRSARSGIGAINRERSMLDNGSRQERKT